MSIISASLISFLFFAVTTLQPLSNARRNSESCQPVSFNSVENLLLNLTSDNLLSNYSIPDKHCPLRNQMSASTMNLSPIQPYDSSTNLHRSHSLSHGLLDIQTRYETAFGPENQTVTRIYYIDGSSADLANNGLEHDRMYFDNPSTSSPKPDLIENTDHCQSTYGVNYARVRSIRKNSSSSESQCTHTIRKPTYGCAIALVRPGNKCCDSSNACHEDTSLYHSANTSLLSNRSTYRTPPSRTDQCISRNSSPVVEPPIYMYPPSYDTIFPSRGRRRHRSLSGPSVPKCPNSESSEAVNLHCSSSSRTLPQRSVNEKQDAVHYRSMSTSDLTHDTAFTSNLAPKVTNCSTKSKENFVFQTSINSYCFYFIYLLFIICISILKLLSISNNIQNRLPTHHHHQL